MKSRVGVVINFRLVHRFKIQQSRTKKSSTKRHKLKYNHFCIALLRGVFFFRFFFNDLSVKSFSSDGANLPWRNVRQMYRRSLVIARKLYLEDVRFLVLFAKKSRSGATR